MLIVDDHPSFRASARLLLESEGYEVIGEAPDGASGIAQSASLRPDLVLLDAGEEVGEVDDARSEGAAHQAVAGGGAVKGVVFEVDVEQHGHHTPGELQRLLSDGERVAGVERDADVLPADLLAQPQQVLGAGVLVVLQR